MRPSERLALIRGVLLTGAALMGLNWLSQAFSTPNQRLVDLVVGMSHQQTLSTIVSSALVGVAILVAAVLVPFMTLFAIRRHERQLPAPSNRQVLVVQSHDDLPPGSPVVYLVANPERLNPDDPEGAELPAQLAKPPTPAC